MRYAWLDQALRQGVHCPRRTQASASDRADAVLTHRTLGMVVFVVVLLVMFQAVYTWAALGDGGRSTRVWGGSRKCSVAGCRRERCAA